MPNWKRVITSGSSAQLNSLSIDGKNLDTSGVTRDQVLKFNGTHFVPAAHDATFTFSITSFAMSETTTTQLIGTGTWKAIGAITWTVVYANGPPDGYGGASEGQPRLREQEDGVNKSWVNDLNGSSYVTGTNSLAIAYPPDTGDDIRFELEASAGTDEDDTYTAQRIYFRNYFAWGSLTNNTGNVATDDVIDGLITNDSEITSDTSREFSGGGSYPAITVASGKYLGFTHRTGDSLISQVRCGEGVNEITVAMNPGDAESLVVRETRDDYENSALKQEDFYVYASKIQLYGIHSTTFTTLYNNNDPKNYIFWGHDTQADTYDATFITTAGSWDDHNQDSSYDDGTITGQAFSIGTFTSKYVIIAMPDRIGANDVDFQFKDNNNLAFDVTQQADVDITNPCGFQETYHVWRSTNLLTYADAPGLTITAVAL